MMGGNVCWCLLLEGWCVDWFEDWAGESLTPRSCWESVCVAVALRHLNSSGFQRFQYSRERIWNFHWITKQESSNSLIAPGRVTCLPQSSPRPFALKQAASSNTLPTRGLKPEFDLKASYTLLKDNRSFQILSLVLSDSSQTAVWWSPIPRRPLAMLNKFASSKLYDIIACDTLERK